MLTIRDLTAGYGEVTVLHNLSLTIEKGSIVVLMGPNGAGKSTVLRSIMNTTTRTAGTTTFLGEDISRLPTHTITQRGISYMPQGRINFGLLTVEENLSIGRSTKDGASIEQRLRLLSQLFPVLWRKRRSYAFHLSGGEQQMLAMARALLADPKLLLLDEPSLGLAPRLVRETFATIRAVREQCDLTILVVEHNIRSVLQLADRGIILVEGRVVADDTPDRLRAGDLLQKVFIGTFE